MGKNVTNVKDAVNVENVNKVINVENVNVNATSETQEQEQSNYKKIIKSLIGEGAKKFNAIRIKNVNSKVEENHIRVSFTLATPIRGFITNDNGETWEQGKTNVIYTSLYAIIGALKEDEDLSWLANSIMKIIDETQDTSILNLLFNGATIDILQQEFSAGEEFTNPFSTKKETQVYDHDVIINHVIKFELSKVGNRVADRIIDKTIGF